LKNGKIKIIEGTGHGFSKKRQETIATTVDWMKHYL
jgi:dipeptidyl aminopeptidase/acylaminoacyl peptidase